MNAWKSLGAMFVTRETSLADDAIALISQRSTYFGARAREGENHFAFERMIDHRTCVAQSRYNCMRVRVCGCCVCEHRASYFSTSTLHPEHDCWHFPPSSSLTTSAGIRASCLA